jgi:hypothetical protein
LLVARLIGRNLTPLQGCIVQVAAIAIIGFLAWAFIASGLMTHMIEPIAQWYTSQVFPAHPSPSTLP